MSNPTPEETEQAQVVVDALFNTSPMVPVRAALVGAMAQAAAHARDRERKRCAQLARTTVLGQPHKLLVKSDNIEDLISSVAQQSARMMAGAIAEAIEAGP